MYVDGVSLYHGAVSLLGVLLGCMRKVARNDRTPHLVVVAPRRQNVHLVKIGRRGRGGGGVLSLGMAAVVWP